MQNLRWKIITIVTVFIIFAGLGVYPIDAEDERSLMLRADLEMYRDKERHRGDTLVVVEGRNPELTPVSEVMTTNLATIQESATLDEALECMNQHSCRHLPVMCGRQVVGFVSMRDLMNFELDRKTEELNHLHNYVHGST